MAGSSDAPVITADPLLGIRDAVLRRTADGQVLGPAERLTARDALDLYTTRPPSPCTARTRSARSSRASSPTSWCWTPARCDADPEQIADIEVLATVLGGTPVYQSESIFPGW